MLHRPKAPLAHAIPAAFFIASSLLFLILVVGRRLRSLEASRRNFQAYCELYMPEPNSTLLKWAGWTTIGYCFVGVVLHSVGGINTPAHVVLYTSFSFTGCVSILEAYRKLPPNAAVMALAFAFVLQGILWNEHGLMKKHEAERRTHILQAHVSFACGALFAFSVWKRYSLVVFVFGWAAMLLNGIWMFTIGLGWCCIELTINHVPAYFVMESVFVAALVVVGAVFCLPNCVEQHACRMVSAGKEGECEEENETELCMLD